ncbi:MAG: winged helix-turn-helix domain-containing protein [Myxococcota bacterium]
MIERRALLEAGVQACVDPREPADALSLVVRLLGGGEGTRWRFGDHELDLERHRLHGPDGARELSPIESGLLSRLAAARGQPVRREQLLREVWGHRTSVVTRSVDNTVSRLRAKLEPDPKQPAHLITIRGEGYALVGAEPLAPTSAAGSVIDRPPPAPPLVGRESLLAQIEAARGRSRVVTLTGLPGVGKSVLAWTALAGGGIYVRSVGPMVRLAVAEALGTTLAHLEASLASVALPVLLDDVDEGLEEAAALVSRAITAHERLQFVVASRRPLRIRGEAVVRVTPLDPATALGWLSARTGCPGARLCALAERLGGLPLGLSLAAHTLTLLDPEDLAARNLIADLQDPSRQPERHQSLAAAIAWTPPTAMQRAWMAALAGGRSIGNEAAEQLARAGWLAPSDRALHPVLAAWARSAETDGERTGSAARAK